MKEEKKKLLFIAAGIVGFVILIIIILLLYHALSGDKKLSYNELENKISSAAKSYYSDNKDLLPSEVGEQTTVTDSTLVSAGNLKPLSKYVDDDVTCSATVIVTKEDEDNYRYRTLLDCGDKYTSLTFADYFSQKVEKVITGDGLYELNGELVFRGDNPNNYVKISGNMYRVVKVSGDRVLIITNERLDNVIWDDRYNIDIDYAAGINDYKKSRIKDSLKEVYENGDFIGDKEKYLVGKQTLQIGKRSVDYGYNDGSSEKAELAENELLGLLPLYDYLNASTDVNCIDSTSQSCSNYNYLNYYDYFWWTITGDANNTSKAYRISGDGIVELYSTDGAGFLRPTALLVSDALYVKGSGTLDDPYIIK